MGQHFLADGRILSRIVAAAEIEPQDLVLEVGPGTGALTRRLTGRGARVVALELDPQLAADLPARLGNPPNLTVVECDARSLDPALVLQQDSAGYKVLGNLPYYAANPIIRRFLESAHKPRLMVVTLQQEVAQTMTAKPGKMGFLSVAVQYYADVRMVCSIPPRAFRPPPKVTSAVVRLDVRTDPPVDVSDTPAFFSLVRAGFSAPRKQLRNSLAQGLRAPTATVSQLLAESDLDGSRRPATLCLEEWAAIFSTWEQLGQFGSPGLR